MMFIIDCDIENGGMQLNNDFCVDFGEEPDGPSLAHEVKTNMGAGKIMSMSVFMKFFRIL